MEEGIGKMLWNGMNYLLLDFTSYEVVLSIVQKWWDLSSGNRVIQTIVMVTHCIIIFCCGFAMLKDKAYTSLI